MLADYQRCVLQASFKIMILYLVIICVCGTMLHAFAFELSCHSVINREP